MGQLCTSQWLYRVAASVVHSGSGVQTWGEVRVSPSNVVPPQCRASSGVPTAATMLHILCFEMMSGSVQGTLGIVLWYVGLGLLGALSVSMLA